MKHLILIISFLGLFITSCSDKKEKATDQNNAVVVKIQKVSNEAKNNLLSVSGKVMPVEYATLSTRSMGHVQKVYVKVGERVAKGKLLLSINNADLNAQKAQAEAGISEAKAAFQNAEKDYKRFKNLFENKSASQKELDDVTAQYNMAKARLYAAQQMKEGVNAQFSYSNIRAPFSGVITQKNVNAGDLANPGMPLITMENPSKFEIIAMIPESEVAKVKKDQEVEILIKSINQKTKGKVSVVSSSAQNTGGQYLVKVALKEKPEALRSGMYATIYFPIKSGATTQMIAVPTSALVKQGELTGIYTVSQSNTAILRWLRLGQQLGDNVEVLSGLSADESYIISAEGKLYNGVKVNPIQ
ncbi:RND family efflux transporter MFP subunit [Balneicella halophila]|uniref:RND family efflux transporter MFP subunit n=1 Tax=Balneicella halophila TaxID=1537566 RepID=A0A7L4URS4_BALHA|nr:efflux RND transporter periplasmic adaptor subunit [Balneicella halophila]PVX52131.1 RND family efflux transporter MFP subunit [Balneicella halophila]